MRETLLDSPKARIIRICCGPFESLCYLVEDKIDKRAFLIDAGCPAGEVVELVEERDLKLEAILITHAHFDHVLEVNAIAKATVSKPIAHSSDVQMLPVYWKESLGEIPQILPLAEEGLLLSLKSFSFEVLHTPGHTPGSVCYYSRDLGVIFTGDTLFKGAVGTLAYSYDPEGYKKMRKSLKKLSTLPGETRVFPGHGEATTIEEEKGMMRNF